jgi:hypothetical protein
MKKVLEVEKVGVVLTSHLIPDITTLAAVRSGRSDLLAFSAIHVTENQTEKMIGEVKLNAVSLELYTQLLR